MYFVYLVVMLVLGKIKFFGLVAFLVAAPFVLFKMVWLARSVRVMGCYSFAGMGEAGEQVRLDYSICWFPVGKDTVWFNGMGNLPFRPGDAIPVRYQADDPADAKVDIFAAIWGDTVVDTGVPLFMLLAVFLHPKVVPWGRKVAVRRQPPFVQVV